MYQKTNYKETPPKKIHMKSLSLPPQNSYRHHLPKANSTNIRRLPEAANTDTNSRD